MSIKLRAPEGMGAISHGGIDYPIGEDGSVNVPNQGIADAMAAHGVRPWNDGSAEVPISAMTRAQLVGLVMKKTLATIEALSTEDIRARLLSVDPETVDLPDETEGAGVIIPPEVAEKIPAAAIEAMNRPELFAFLKARGVPVALPIKNDELRAAARAAVTPTGA